MPLDRTWALGTIVSMTRRQFEEIVAEAIDGLPREFRARMENVIVEVRDRPTRKQLEDNHVPPGETLLGLYEGVPLSERPEGLDPIFPDRIFIFQRPLEECFRTRARLIEEIRETVIHEIGHFFGLDHGDMEE